MKPASLSSSSVQVVVRLRPMNDKEKKHGTLPVVTASTQDKTVTVIKGQGSRQMKNSFSFDNVFTAFSAQEEVFEETLKPVISDVMKGYESTVFAYGQTGTGKTHTMEGSLSSPEMYGVIPRSAQAIFEALKQPQYSDHTVTCSYLEIYNEELCDLLVDEVHRSSDRKAVKLEIMDGKNGTFCRGLSEVEVSSAEEVLDLMKQAEQQRKIGETKMNKQSSRSHCIFSMRVKANSTLSDGSGIMEFNGKLHMVDLAGSECAKTASLDKASGAEAARERERMNINRSLLTLGRVISMLKEQSDKKRSSMRIPYRDSKLTRILQESLGGRCKTVIIATLSPSITAIEESISTLNYAQSANGIVNKPVATSYMNLTPSRSLAVAPGTCGNVGDSTGDDNGNSIEHWHEMECRLQYMQAQVEEAQAALARKHMQQQELVERVEKAEADKLEIEKKYFDATIQVNGLKENLAEEIKKKDEVTSQLKDTEMSLKKTTAILHATQKTEECLTKEATKLLGTLKESIAYGDTLHALVVSQTELQADYKRAGKKFHSASLEVLKETSVLLSDLSSKNEHYHGLIRRSAVEVHEQEQKFVDEMSSLMKKIRQDVKDLSDTIKAQAVDDGGLIPTLNDLSSSAMKGVDQASTIITQGEDGLLNSCRAAREHLKECSNRLKHLSDSHSMKSTESLSTLESGISLSKEKIAAMIRSVSEALSAAQDARSQARTAHNELLKQWKVSSLDASRSVADKSKEQSNILSKTLEFFGTEMEKHDKIDSSLKDQSKYIVENGDAHIIQVTEQASMLSKQKESLASANERNEKMRERFMQTVMNGVQELMAKQLELMKVEQNEQSTALESSTQNLTKVNTAMGQSAKNIFAKVGSTNSMLKEHAQAVRKNDTRVKNIMENTKVTLDEIASSSHAHQESTSSFAKKAADAISLMEKLDSQTKETIERFENDGAQCSSHIENVVLEETKSRLDDLTQAGKEMDSLCSNAVINFVSDIDSIENPRKKIMESFDRRVKEVVSSISSGQENMKAIAEKQCDTADALCAGVEKRETEFQNDTASCRRKQMDKDRACITQATSDHAVSAGGILSNAASLSNSMRDQILDFSSNSLKVEEEVAAAPARNSPTFSNHLTNTPSENIILGGLELGSSVLTNSSNLNAMESNAKNDSPQNDENMDISDPRQGREGSFGSVGSSSVPASPSTSLVLQERSLNRDVVMTSGKAKKPGTERKARPLKNSAVKKAGVRRSASTPPAFSRKKARVATTPTRHASVKGPRMRKQK